MVKSFSSEEPDTVTKEEEKKRDKLIYDVIIERYNLEWQRTNDIDSKASSIIGFAGIIAGIHTGVMELLPLLNSRSLNYISLSIPLVLLGSSIFLALYGYWVKTWEVINPVRLIEQYKDKEHDVVLRRVASTLSEITMKNCEVNKKKVNSVRLSLTMLVLGVISILAISLFRI